MIGTIGAVVGILAIYAFLGAVFIWLPLVISRRVVKLNAVVSFFSLFDKVNQFVGKLLDKIFTFCTARLLVFWKLIAKLVGIIILGIVVFLVFTNVPTDIILFSIAFAILLLLIDIARSVSR